MISSDQRRAILEAVDSLKKNPFKTTAIKVELEADINGRDDEDYCFKFLMDYVSREVHGCDSNVGEYTASMKNPLPEVSYGEFYDDGSVNSELTFTIKLDNPDNIFLLPIFLEAWNTLAEEAGGQDVSGAGMHMALLNTSNCSYPSSVTQTNYGRFLNFRKSMSLVLPALYFLGTHNKYSRDLEYRKPSIECTDEAHGYDKFHAIGYNRGAIEFRVFDTCYDNPEAIFDNVIVMNNAMKFWKRRYVSSGLENITSEITFGTSGTTIDRFYTTVKHVDLLDEGLKILKPSYRTLDELKEERGFELTRESLANQETDWIKQATEDYDEYSERFDWSLSELAKKERGHLLASKASRAENTINQIIQGRLKAKVPLDKFIGDRLKLHYDMISGAYRISVNQ